jgi:two-component system response regulator NreC
MMSPLSPPALASPSHTPAGQRAAVRVMLADDGAVTRRSLQALLGAAGGVDVVHRDSARGSVESQLKFAEPDVLVLDVSMPSGATIAAIKRLRETAPHTQIVVLATGEDPLFAHRALAAGALGFVAKRSPDLELGDAVHAAARGEPYISAPVAAELGSLGRSLAEDRLTARELEVLRLIAFGHTSVEIARTLQLSPRTVETHRGRIHKKLKLTTRADLVAHALRRGLLRP